MEIYDAKQILEQHLEFQSATGGPAMAPLCEALRMAVRGFESEPSVLDRNRELLMERAELELELARTRGRLEEALRAERWHATYNAALTGHLTGGATNSDADARAAEVANHRHGKLDGAT